MPGDKRAAIRTFRRNRALRALLVNTTVRSCADLDIMRADIIEHLIDQVDLALVDVEEGDSFVLTAIDYTIFREDGSNRATTLDRTSPASRTWRGAVLDRDNHACVRCGAVTGLHAHHVQEWATHPHLRFDVDNGLTLCGDCHRAEHSARV